MAWAKLFVSFVVLITVTVHLPYCQQNLEPRLQLVFADGLPNAHACDVTARMRTDSTGTSHVTPISGVACMRQCSTNIPILPASAGVGAFKRQGSTRRADRHSTGASFGGARPAPSPALPPPPRNSWTNESAVFSPTPRPLPVRSL